MVKRALVCGLVAWYAFACSGILKAAEAEASSPASASAPATATATAPTSASTPTTSQQSSQASREAQRKLELQRDKAIREMQHPGDGMGMIAPPPEVIFTPNVRRNKPERSNNPDAPDQSNWLLQALEDQQERSEKASDDAMRETQGKIVRKDGDERDYLEDELAKEKDEGGTDNWIFKTYARQQKEREERVEAYRERAKEELADETAASEESAAIPSKQSSLLTKMSEATKKGPGNQDEGNGSTLGSEGGDLEFEVGPDTTFTQGDDDFTNVLTTTSEPTTTAQSWDAPPATSAYQPGAANPSAPGAPSSYQNLSTPAQSNFATNSPSSPGAQASTPTWNSAANTPQSATVQLSPHEANMRIEQMQQQNQQQRQNMIDQARQAEAARQAQAKRQQRIIHRPGFGGRIADPNDF